MDKPAIGMIVKVLGQDCRITKIRPFGTIDVESLDGLRAYRVSGLGFGRAELSPGAHEEPFANGPDTNF